MGDCARPGCDAPTGDNSRLCREDVRRLRRMLAEIPDRIEQVTTPAVDAFGNPRHRIIRADDGELVDHGPMSVTREHVIPGLASDLITTMTRQDKLTLRSGSSAETPVPWNEHARAAHDSLRATLAQWARATAARDEDERDQFEQIDLELVPLAEWLIRNTHTVRMLTDAGTAHVDIASAIRKARVVVDRPPNRARFRVGPCPEVRDGEPCNGEIWAYIPTSETDPALMRCHEPGCPAEWDTTQWIRAARRIRRRAIRLGYPMPR